MSGPGPPTVDGATVDRATVGSATVGPATKGTATVGDLLRTTAGRIGTREARWVVAAAVTVAPSRLLSRLSCPLPPGAGERVEGLVSRRLSGEPLQYVLGTWSFRALELAVDPRALIPRPETEQLVSHALSALSRAGLQGPGSYRGSSRDAGLVAVELGTGSGAIALSLAAEIRDARVYATERSPEALALAALNLERHPELAERVELLAGSWFEPLPQALRGMVDLIVSNPPYIAEAELEGLGPELTYEPTEALVAGPLGTEAISSVLDGAREWLAPGGLVAVEIAPSQAEAVKSMATAAGLCLPEVALDLAGRPRVLLALAGAGRHDPEPSSR
ncbi:MAG: peptide chain release factor N(5)-glutamine methyltransferase [Acidimicrobiales bacterium]